MNLPGIGDVTGYIEAWRAWDTFCLDPDSPQFHPDGTPRLISVTKRDEWPARRPMKACCMDDLCGRHEKFGTCGLWAMKEKPTFGDIIGRVALWGEVIEHEKGYRAEYAYPISLVWVPGKPDPAKLAVRYGCEVEKPSYDELWDMVANPPKLTYRSPLNPFLVQNISDAQRKRLQAQLQNAKPGDIIQYPSTPSSMLGAAGALFGSFFR